MDYFVSHETANFFYSVFYECRCTQIMKIIKGDQRKQTQTIAYLLIYFNRCDVAVDGNLVVVRMQDYKFGRNIFFSSFFNMAVRTSAADRVVTTRSVTKSASEKLIICEDKMSK